MNRIFRVVWNTALGQWVVTSELGRAKVKSATSKTLMGLVLSTLSATALSVPCDISSLTCQLDSNWSATANNYQTGTAVISDGLTYTIDGLKSIAPASGSMITFGSINAAITAGYATGELVSLSDKALELSAKNKNIVVFDPITNSNQVAVVYDEKYFIERTTNQSINSVMVYASGTPNIYYDTRLVSVNHGQADIYNNNNSISASFRNSQLFYADGSTNRAAINWHGASNIAFGWESSSIGNTSVTTSSTAYKGDFIGFNGLSRTVTNLAEFKAYNNWLVSKVESGDLSLSAYDSELSKAYTTTRKSYVVRMLPTDPDPLLLAPAGTVVLLHGKGSNATITLESDGRLFSSSLRGLDNGGVNTSLFRLENGAKGINNGEIVSGFRTAVVYTGSQFINNGRITTGSATGGGEGYGITITGANSEFINNGTFSVIPRFWSTLASQNQSSNMMAIINGNGKATNHGIVNIGSTEGTRGTDYLGPAYGASVSTDGSFLNASDGNMYVGRSENGSDLFAAKGSAAINVGALRSGTVNNQGTITLGTKTNGAYGIGVSSSTTGKIVNSGLITLLGNGGNGSFIPFQNMGIYAYSNAKGVSNTGEIRVGGINNVGLKTAGGGNITSSGEVNILGASDPATGFRNYGAWSEGTNSLIDIAGTINLTGDGAIGAHARNNGTISLSGAGQVRFYDGENQIGYYVYGSGSNINNTSSGTQNVTTKNSTLMRLDGGASFTGSPAATSIMSASGDHSTVIVATGSGTTVNSGGMTVNVNGHQATGFLVEGGATGTISNTTTINLSGEGAIAGIADGQGYELTGAQTVMTNEQKKETILTAGAVLNSALDGVVGYLAKNMATINNSGDITFTGKNATGVGVQEGAEGINSGNIALGDNGIGLLASADTHDTRLINTGSLTLNGSHSIGISASGIKVTVDMKTDGTSSPTIKMNGDGAVGVKAANGSSVNLDGNVATKFSATASDQIAFWLNGQSNDGVSSSVNVAASATPYNVSGERSTLFYVDNKASLDGDLTVNVSGKHASGVKVSGDGSLATVGAGSHILVNGDGASGVLVQLAGNVNIASGAAFTLNGSGATVGIVEDSNSQIINGATVTSAAGSQDSTAFIARNNGELNNTGNIDLSAGSKHVAIDVFNGIVTNTGSIKASGTAIHIRGENSVINNSGTIEASDGKAAIELGVDGSLNLAALSGNGTITAKGSADGILLSAGAKGLNVSGTTIDMSDSTSTGVGIHNQAGISGIRLDNTTININDGIGIYTGATLDKTNSGNINVSGGIGLLLQNTDGTATANNLDLSGSDGLFIDISGSGGRGIVANLAGSDRIVDSAVNINVNHSAGGSALDITGATRLNQMGQLISMAGDVIKAGSTGSITNSGKIEAGDRLLSAIVMDGSIDKTLINSGSIKGKLDLIGGENRVTLTDGSTIDGDIALGSGNNNQIALTGTHNSLTGNVTAAGESSIVTLSDNAAITGSIVLGNGNNQVILSDNSLLSGRLSVGSSNNLLTLQDNASIGHFSAAHHSHNQVLVKDSATFATLDAGIGGGNSALTFDGTDYRLINTSDIQHFNQLNLINGADFTTGVHIQMGDTVTTSGVINIDDRSSLTLNPTTDYSLNHLLQGTGLINVVSGSSFNFGPESGQGFNGLVQINSQDFTLSGFNTSALTNATLAVMENNTTSVGQGSQNISGLVLNGGTLDFGIHLPNESVTKSFINVTDTLDVTANGNIKIHQGGFENSTPPMVNQTLSLLDQQNETLIQLASAVNVNGGAGNLTLVDQNNLAITDISSAAITQNGALAAKAFYDYRLATDGENGKGLYVAYGLTQLDLIGSGTDKLVINTANSRDKMLSAQVTGSGSLGVLAGNGVDALILSNLNNSYTGVTDLQTGTLILGTDGALGQTTALNLALATTLNLNGTKQTVGEINGRNGSTLNVNGGDLTLIHGGSSSGSLTGSGNFSVTDGTLTINNANHSLSASVTLDAAATALLYDINALGTGSVANNGNLTFDAVSGSFANHVSGSGQLNSSNSSNVHLTGDNSSFTGAINIDSTSALTVSETQHVGDAIEIRNANLLRVDNSTDMSLSTVISGTGDLIKTSGGTLSLSGTNSYIGDTLLNAGVVAISSDENLGHTGNQTILDGGELRITADLTSARNLTLHQNGSVIVDSGVIAQMSGWSDNGNVANGFSKKGDGTLVWNGNNSANTADINVNGGTLEVANLMNLASATGVVNLGINGRLSVRKESSVASDMDFTRRISGQGELLINLGDRTKNFTVNTSALGGSYTGLLTMANGHLSLDANADNLMQHATLKLDGNGSNIGSTKLNGSHTMQGLMLNGGQLEVDYASIDNRPLGHLTVDMLDVSGGGSLAVSTPANLPNPIPASGTSLFDQDDNVHDQIVAANRVNQAGTQIAVTQVDGTPIAPDTLIGLIQNSIQAGNAHYNYMSAVKNDGLYLGYGLTQLDSFIGQSVILENGNAVDNSLGARLTGEGGFTIDVGGTVRIGNVASNYTGATELNRGTVVLITDNAFGQTSELNMLSGTGINLNGNSQTIGHLTSATNSLLDLNLGQLTLVNGGIVNGNLSGKGSLVLAGNTTVFNSNSSGFVGETTINSNATARLTAPQGLGQGVIDNQGLLHIDGARGSLFNSLKGSDGEVLLSNGADITLAGNNSGYAGKFTIESDNSLTAGKTSHLGQSSVDNSGMLILDTEALFTVTNQISGNGKLIKRGSGTVQLDGNSVSATLTEIDNGLLLVGGMPTASLSRAISANLTSDVTIHRDGALGGYGSVNGNVSNAGHLLMGNALTGAGSGQFTINGNYIGNGGTVIFNTELANDGADTDKLIVTGTTSGESHVAVISARGNGAQTSNGIKLIDVAGISAGTFKLQGRAVGGAYEYFLYQGGVDTPDDGDWYLRSVMNSPSPTPDSIYRPESGAYMANIAAARNLFSLRLEDREGRAENSSMWLRQTGSRTQFRDDSGQLKTATNSYVIQGGGEVFSTQFSDTDRLGLGLMMGYGNADSHVHSDRSSYNAKGKVDGYSAGLYATWYQNANSLSGAYVDSWLQYSWLDATVNGEQLSGETYDIDGFSASVETGYRLPVYQSDNGEVFITPQAQLVWNGIKADDNTETGGTRVQSGGNDNIQTRLGIKISRDGVTDADKGKDRLFTVYAEGNWIYNSQLASATLDGTTLQQSGSRNIGELKLGTEGQLNSGLNLWANVAQQLGDDGYSDTSAMVGIKYRF